jgi:hypothetical protein
MNNYLNPGDAGFFIGKNIARCIVVAFWQENFCQERNVL